MLFSQQYDIDAQLKAIEKMTKEITSSRKKTREYLKTSGISDFIERATKEAVLANSSSENGK